MKKLLLCLVIILSGCTLPVTYNDTHQPKTPNVNLLPAMHTKVNASNLKAAFTDISEDKKKSNAKIRDVTVDDAVNIFEREVEQNITVGEGSKQGRISMRIQYVDLSNSAALRAASMATLGILNLVGFPSDKFTQTMEVEVEVMNLKGGVIKRYVETVEDSEYRALYWGYKRPYINRKLAADNVMHALRIIRAKINDDAEYIKSELKKK